jgi:hypothetical protein
MNMNTIRLLLCVLWWMATGPRGQAQTQAQKPPGAPGSAAATPSASEASGAIQDRTATFFMGRLKYSNNNGNDCSAVGTELMKLVSSTSTIRVQRERTLAIQSPELFETPFLFMNGHDKFTLTEEELGIFRKYFSHGGFLLASGCCTNPAFPAAVRQELGRIFPGESVRALPYEHGIYRAFHRIESVPSLHERKEIHLEGLFYEGRLVAVLCEDGLCCSFSMENRCNNGKGVPPIHGRKLALNIAIYALTH